MKKDWSRERWRRLYLREPTTQAIWDWRTRGLRDLLIRVADEDGHVARNLPSMRRLLRAGEEIDQHVSELLEDGFLEEREGGIYVRNLPVAQGNEAAAAVAPATERSRRVTGRWAGTTPEERSAAARQAADARWSHRADARGTHADASGDASPNASGDASGPRAASGCLDPLENSEDQPEKPEEKRASDARAHAPVTHELTHRGTTHRTRDAFAASFGTAHDDDVWAFERWQKAFGKDGAEFTGRRTVALTDRRLAGMTRQDVEDALAGARLDPYVTGEKDGHRHDSVNFLFGDPDRYEAFRDAGRAVREGRAPVRTAPDRRGARAPVQPSHGMTGFEGAKVIR